MMEREEEEEGVAAVGLVAMACLVEGENVAVLMDLKLVELVALVRLYPAKSAESEVLEVQAEVRGIR